MRFYQKPRFPSAHSSSINLLVQLLASTSFQAAEELQFLVYGNTSPFNDTDLLNRVWNNYTVAGDQSQILT